MDKDREAFEEWLSSSGLAPDDEFEHYHLDEGSLYWLWGSAWQAATERAKERERELAMLLRKAVQALPLDEEKRINASSEIRYAIKQYESEADDA